MYQGIKFIFQCWRSGPWACWALQSCVSPFLRPGFLEFGLNAFNTGDSSTSLFLFFKLIITEQDIPDWQSIPTAHFSLSYSLITSNFVPRSTILLKKTKQNLRQGLSMSPWLAWTLLYRWGWPLTATDLFASQVLGLRCAIPYWAQTHHSYWEYGSGF